MRRTLIVAFTTLVLAGAALAQAKKPEETGAVYEWVDDRGQSHFTDDAASIPERFRARARRLDAPMPTRIRNDNPATGSSSGGGSDDEGGRPALPGFAGQRIADEAVDADGGTAAASGESRTEEETWREGFREKRQRIAGLERQLAEDKALLEGPTLAPRLTPTGYRSRAPEVQERMKKNEEELARTRQELGDLERRARDEAVPLEWRND